MFGLRTRTRRPLVSSIARNVHLVLERLEGRDCPAPVLENFSANPFPNNVWVFSGHVTDTNGPQNDIIHFTGTKWANSLSTAVDANGDWSVTVNVPSGTNSLLGAWAVDLNNNASNEMYALVQQS